MSTRRSGRRPGAPATRETILTAARRCFAVGGYRGASIRAIAGEAGVDPALIHHYFGTKRGLFAAVVDIPIDPATVAQRLVRVPLDRLGEEVVRAFLAVWSPPAMRERLRILLTEVATDSDVARMLHEFLVDTLLGPLAERLEADRPRLRATLAASQMIGFGLAAYVVGIEPLATLTDEDIVSVYAPTIEHYLTGDLAASPR